MPEIDLKVRLETIKKSLNSIGFTIEEAELQINEVGKLATMAILHRLLKERSTDQKLTPANLQQFLKSNFTPGYLAKVIEEESNRMIDGYLSAVSQNLPQVQKDNFYSQMRTSS